jgi:hypothetical protein
MPSDTLVAFADAPGLFPDPWKPTKATLYRWAREGCNGRKLSTIRIAGRRFVTVGAVREFLGSAGELIAPEGTR